MSATAVANPQTATTPTITAVADPQPQTAPSPAPQPVPTPTPPTPTAPTKTEPTERGKYVAPSDAAEARQRIEDAIAKNSVVKTTNGDVYQFAGRTFGLRQAFSMLGGTFDKGTQLWSVIATNYDNTENCTEFVKKEQERSTKRDEAIAKNEAEIQRRIDAAVAEALKKAGKTTAPAAGMISIADAQAATKKAIKMALAAISNLPEESISKIVTKAYAS